MLVAGVLLAAAFAPGPAQNDAGAVIARLFAATADGPSLSYSWGERWQSLRHRLPKGIRTFACLGPRVWAGGAAGLFVSEDFGETWKPVASWPGGEVTVLEPSAFFALDPTLFAGTTRGLYRSRDGGESWERVGADAIGGAVHDVAWPGPSLLVATSDGLFRSEDAGEHWRRLGLGLPAAPLLALELSRYFGVDPVVFVGTDGAGLYRSRDGGERFERLGPPAWTRRRVYCLYWWGASLFVGTDEGLFVSQDAGASFASAAAVLEGVPIFALAIPAGETQGGSDIIVGTPRGVFKSSDGALSWRHLTEGLGETPVVGFGTFPFPRETDAGRRR